MVNLIPQHAKKTVVREYWIRVAVVWVFLLSGALIIVAISMVPTFLQVNAQQQAFSERMDEARTKQEVFDTAADEIKHANELARYIDGRQAPFKFSTIQTLVDQAAGSDITLTQITFTQSIDEVLPVEIAGKAATRNALASFRDRLLADAAIETAELPIASLAGDRDLPFTMKITFINDDE